MKDKRVAKTLLEPDASWRSLYGAGSAMALLYVILVIVPLAFVFGAPLPPAAGGTAVLEFIAAHTTIYWIELACFVGLAVPALVVFPAVAVSLKGVDKGLAALGGLVGIVSEVLALAMGSSPQSLSAGLLYLSDQYATAASDAQRLALATAAEGFLATANAVSPAGILTALGIFILSIVMLRGIFHRGVALLGIVAGAVGMVFEALRPVLGAAYALYGVLLPAWFIAVGLKLYAVSRSPRLPAA